MLTLGGGKQFVRRQPFPSQVVFNAKSAGTKLFEMLSRVAKVNRQRQTSAVNGKRQPSTLSLNRRVLVLDCQILAGAGTKHSTFVGDGAQGPTDFSRDPGLGVRDAEAD